MLKGAISMTIYTHFVYWIHLPEHTDYNSEGYIGVSNNPKRRFNEHIKGSENPEKNKKNPFLSRVIQKHKERIMMTILVNDTKESCYKLEEQHRPVKNIGWNNNKGGDCPPSKLGWKPSQENLEKRSRSLKGIVRTQQWKNNLSLSKRGEKNWMFGKELPCSDERKISIIQSNYKNRIADLKIALELLSRSNHTVRDISKKTNISTSVICKIKKEQHLYLLAFPGLV